MKIPNNLSSKPRGSFEPLPSVIPDLPFPPLSEEKLETLLKVIHEANQRLSANFRDRLGSLALADLITVEKWRDIQGSVPPSTTYLDRYIKI